MQLSFGCFLSICFIVKVYSTVEVVTQVSDAKMFDVEQVKQEMSKVGLSTQRIYNITENNVLVPLSVTIDDAPNLMWLWILLGVGGFVILLGLWFWYTCETRASKVIIPVALHVRHEISDPFYYYENAHGNILRKQT